MDISNSSIKIKDYPFIKKPFLFEQWLLFRKYGPKFIYKQRRLSVKRSWSKNKILEFIKPQWIGLEIGVGTQTVAPLSQTIFTDAHTEHGNDNFSIAKIFCPSDNIPIEDNQINYVLSEHVLEHIANPIKTLEHWIKKLKKQGVIILFLPHKERTFDKYRQRTPLSHLISDYKNNVSNDDSSHIDDFYQNVIEKGLAPHYKNIKKSLLSKTGNIHHHVWIMEDITELLSYMNLNIIFSAEIVPDREDSFLVIAQKN